MTGFGSELFSGPLYLSVCSMWAILMEKRYFLYHVPTVTETDKSFWKITITFCHISAKNIYPFLYPPIKAISSNFAVYGRQVIPDIKDMISSCLSVSFTAGLLQTVPVSTQAAEGPCLKVMSAPGRKR